VAARRREQVVEEARRVSASLAAASRAWAPKPPSQLLYPGVHGQYAPAVGVL
jgi:hypothetical protein